MKIQIVRFIALFGFTLLCHVSIAQASSLGDLLGLKSTTNPTYASGVTSPQSQYRGATQYEASAYQVEPAKRMQSTDARQPGTPGPVYQRAIPQSQSNARQVTPSKPVSKGKAGHKTATSTRLPSVTTLPLNQQAHNRLAYSYQPISPSQPRYAAPQGYRQPPAPSYYYPYQGQYAPASNSYQGYSYGGWNSGSSAQACAPGRA